jgi:DNA primase
MSGRDLLERIKDRLDIVEVLSDYIDLRKAGTNYKALCPFHSEKTPSFIVSPDKQVFHCFGCGTGGDIVGFVMKHESMSFPEALKFLAQKAGMRPEEYETGEFRGHSEEKASIKALLKDAAKFYMDALAANKEARDYLLKRGLTEESLSRFSLGYAPKGWTALTDHLKRKKYSEEMILKSGVGHAASEGKKGIYDMLRDRIIFPIEDAQGAVIAFGGRVMDDSLPKYLNSPDTMLFKKGETLYGLPQAKEAIRKKGYAVLSEGYLDVIASHQHGFENVLAPLGTALTPGHLKKLSRFTKKLVLVFDGDAAGLGAAKRALGTGLEQSFNLKVAVLPPGDDPDSLLKSKGAPEYKKSLGRAWTPMEFILKSGKGPRVDLIKEAVSLISKTPEPIMREELIRELSETARVREDAIRNELKRGKAPSSKMGKDSGEKIAFLHNEETLLLSVFVNMPEMRDRILKLVSPEELKDSVVKGLILKLKDSETLSEEERALMAKVAIEPGFMTSEADRTVKSCVDRIHLQKLHEEMKGKTGDPHFMKELIQKKKIIKGGNQLP